MESLPHPLERTRLCPWVSREVQGTFCSELQPQWYRSQRTSNRHQVIPIPRLQWVEAELCSA